MMNINKKLKILMTIFFAIIMIGIMSTISFADEIYIDGENADKTEKIKDNGSRQYSQRTTYTAENIFKDFLSDSTRAKYFEPHKADRYSSSSITLAYRQSMQKTDVVYCVNHGGKVDSQRRWMYFVNGYIEIIDSNVTVYKYTGDGSCTKSSYENVPNARYVAAAMAINGPLGGYTEKAIAADGSSSAPTKVESQLGYGTLEEHPKAQKLLWYYWSQTNFLDTIGCSEWKNKNTFEPVDHEKFEEEVDQDSDSIYTAQLIYLDGNLNNEYYYVEDGTNKVVRGTSLFVTKDSKGKITSHRELQQLILAQGEKNASPNKKGNINGFTLKIKKEWNLDGHDSSQVTIPVTIYLSIYKKSGNSEEFIDTVSINKGTNSETGATEYVGTYDKGLSGSFEDYVLKESNNSQWTLDGDPVIIDDEKEKQELTGKYGNTYSGDTSETSSENFNEEQRKVQAKAKEWAEKKYADSAGSGYCLKWIRRVYESALGYAEGGLQGLSNTLYARTCGAASGVSSDFSVIPIGAIVYGYGKDTSTSYPSKYGHCGIYIGDGKVAHCASSVGIMSLADWVATYNGACWGWYSTKVLNSKFSINSYKLMNGDKINATMSKEEINTWTKTNLGHEFSTDIGKKSSVITCKITNKYTPNKDGEQGTIKISGKVFLDADSNKAGVTTNGICDANNQGIAGIKVTWRTKSGMIISSTKTAEDGTYSMKAYVNIWLRGWDYLSKNDPWSLISNAIGVGEALTTKNVRNIGSSELYYFYKNRYDEINESYVEFEYNGCEYTTSKVVNNAQTVAEASKARSEDIDRILVDSKFNEITYDGVTTTNLIAGILNILGDDSIENSIKNLTDSNNEYNEYLTDGGSTDIDSALKDLNGLDKDSLNNNKNSVTDSLLNYFGLKTDKDKYNGTNNTSSQKDYYQSVLNNMKFGSLLGDLVDSLNNIGDSVGLQKVLDAFGEYLEIKSQEEGSANQILDIFNLKDLIDKMTYVLGNGTTYNEITYEKDSNGNEVAQLDQAKLNQYTLKASTKKIINKNMLNGYTYSKSEKHYYNTRFCDAINKKEYIGSLASGYGDLSIMFKENIKESDHDRHTVFSSLDDVLSQLGVGNFEFGVLVDKVAGLLHFVIADPNSSSSNTYTQAGVNNIMLALMNRHTDIVATNGTPLAFSWNCNALNFGQTSDNLVTIATYIATAILSGGSVAWDTDVSKTTVDSSKRIAHAYYAQKMTDSWDITNVNCGLVLREQPDAMLKSDILETKVIMKGQEYTYKYNLRNYDLVDALNLVNVGIHTFNLPVSNNGEDLISTDLVNKVKLVTESLRGQYTRKINPSNISYISNNLGDRANEFQVYVTYWVQVGNQSNSLPMRINKLVNYYEGDCYTYSDDYIAYTDSDGTEYTNKSYGWHAWDSSDGNINTGSYNCVATDILDSTWILPASKSKKVPLTYKLNLTEKSVNELMLNRKLLVNNISEIASYTTRYGLNTMCINGESTLKHPWMLLSGYAGVDKDSRPGNAVNNVKDTMTALLKENGIDMDVSDKITNATEGIFSNVGKDIDLGFINYDFIQSKLEEYGVSKKVSDKLNNLISGGMEKLLNELAGQITDMTGLNLYNLLSKIEDDTSMAPLFKLELPNDNYRSISGIMFEDSNVGTNNERIGNGTYKSDEDETIEGVRVELHRIDSNNNDLGIATLYGIDSNGKSTVQPAITHTNANGEYSFGDGQSIGLIEDYYQVYYIYGDKEHKVQSYTVDEGGQNIKSEQYNDTTDNIQTNVKGNIIDARNYKSTIVSNDIIKGVFKYHDSNESEYEKYKDNWHIILNNSSDSVARDWVSTTQNVARDWNSANLENDNYVQKDETNIYTKRANITSKDLQYNNFDDKYNMTSYTNIFKLGIEYTANNKDVILGQQVDAQGNANTTTIKNSDGSETIIPAIDFKTKVNMNFGIIERPRENIVVDKTISNLKLKFANGQVLFDGDPYSGELPYLIALGPKTNRAGSDSNTRDRLIRIEMDTELMQSAELQITYKISVTNNSEIDYNTKDYYYYGIAGTEEELVTGCVPLLVDYLDSECEFVDNDINQPFNWKVKSIEDLTGLISEDDAQGNVKNAIQEGKYTILTTDYFTNVGINETKSATLYVTKLLSTKADEYTFENHTEILQIDGNRARTIKEVDDRTREQVTKEYKPGNYMPSTETRNDWKKDNTAHISKVGMHEQDDDRITIRITPPTGVITRNGYIAIMIVSLLVIGLGAFAIKKKVLNK